MIRKICDAALLLACLCGAARAQELPSIAVFSPGFKRLAALEAARPAVTAQAEIDIDEAAYARDLSVLSAMLSGTTFAYQADDAAQTLQIAREGETLGTYAVETDETMDALTEALLGKAILERVSLSLIADWLDGLSAGDALPFGFAVSEPFAIERTMSDDGTRLTKISVDGAIAREGEAAYKVEGYLRQPAGRAPKDTFELTFTQDEDNYIELLYSALRENEVTRKEREGTTSVRTTLKAAGKLAGSGISSRLTVTMKNRWTADGDALTERVRITASLGHTDRRPGMRWLRLNDVAASSEHALTITTHEAGDEVIAFIDALSLDVTLDGNAFLSAGADVTVRVGGQAQPAAQDAEPMTQEAVEALAGKLYRRLDDDVKATIQEGL